MVVSESKRNPSIPVGGGGINGHKRSTVVPGNITGEDSTHELTDVDLAMKLHYLKVVYYIPGVDGIELIDLKEPLFRILDVYYPIAGRVRRSDADRPFLKCNDSGVRIVEAKCGQTMDEWLGTKGKDPTGYSPQLVPGDVLGPDLFFSPTVLIQFTRFACGGITVGFSWAHVLGDAISAADFINCWGQGVTTGILPPKSLRIRDLQIGTPNPTKESEPLLSVKQVEPVGDRWFAPNAYEMSTSIVHFTEADLNGLKSKIHGSTTHFEALTATIWHCLARIRTGRETKSVTVCRYIGSRERKEILGNELAISTVTSDGSPLVAELFDLARKIRDQTGDEKAAIRDFVRGSGGNMDYVVYGANLTFVDMEGVELYGLDLKGRKPIRVDFSIDGVGDEGTVLVTPESGGGASVTLIVAAGEMQELTEMLLSEMQV